MDQKIKHNIIFLAFCSGLSISANVALGTVSALACFQLTGSMSLSTIPFALQYFSSMAFTTLASFLMKHIGRKNGFILGTLLGMIGGMCLMTAMLKLNFMLFCLGGFFVGAANAFSFYYRFAVAEMVEDTYKSRAIGYVMAGGVIGAVVGPNISAWMSQLFPQFIYAGSFVSVGMLFLLSFLFLLFVEIPKPSFIVQHLTGRPLGQILRQPMCLAGILCAVIGYGIMTFLMVATPLTMHEHMHGLNHVAFVIQWHVLGMFAPSFVTGALISRYGLTRIMFVGVILNGLCVGINLLGESVGHFWLAMLLLGIGWNFLFIGGTTMLTKAYQPTERAKVEPLNDFFIFLTVALSSYFSGVMLEWIGWININFLAIPWIISVAGIIIWARNRSSNLTVEDQNGQYN